MENVKMENGNLILEGRDIFRCALIMECFELGTNVIDCLFVHTGSLVAYSFPNKDWYIKSRSAAQGQGIINNIFRQAQDAQFKPISFKRSFL